MKQRLAIPLAVAEHIEVVEEEAVMREGLTEIEETMRDTIEVVEITEEEDTAKIVVKVFGTLIKGERIMEDLIEAEVEDTEAEVETMQEDMIQAGEAEADSDRIHMQIPMESIPLRIRDPHSLR
mmetsp:Transcript_11669/g.21122  ORF Transcript_11669/g.21122 Transcript_11669/m.21122 type:complete len:124 (+) Transcript_11669:1611-1982(+)